MEFSILDLLLVLLAAWLVGLYALPPGSIGFQVSFSVFEGSRSRRADRTRW